VRAACRIQQHLRIILSVAGNHKKFGRQRHREGDGWERKRPAKSSGVGVTMFVQDIETFSVLHDFWVTTLSNPFDFLTTRCTFLSSIRISTFFYCRCVMFAVGGDPVLRVQKYQDIETHVTAKSQ
jgi:hypothetical protein